LATFKEQVQGITSLSVGTTPTDDELSQFLVDGTKEVVNRIIAGRPDEIPKFTVSTHDSNDSGITVVGQVMSVVREHDSEAILRRCSPIDPMLRYEATDTDSLSYRSKYNPGFYQLNGKIFLVPASASGNNDSIVTQVYYAVNQGHSSSSIDNFPDEYEYLVVLYASMRTIHANLAIKSAPIVPVSQALPILNITATEPTAISLTTVNYNPIIASASTALTSLTAPTYTKPTVALSVAPTISNLNITAVTPDVPTVTASTVSFSAAIPAYNPPSVSLDSAPSIGNLTITASVPSAPSLSTITFSSIDGTVDASLVPAAASTTLGGTSTAPGYDTTVATDALGEANDFIDNNEDVELANAKLAEVQALMQDELNDFNKENIAFQAGIQEAMAEFQSANQIAISNAERSQNRQLQNSINDMQAIMQNNQSLIQKYQAQLQSYQQEVASQVQAYQQNLAGDLQVWQAERTTDLQQYSSDMQNELNNFNELNAVYQAQLQISIQNAQLEDAEESKKLQQYATELQHYQAEVATQVQEYQQNLAGNIQVWQAERQTDLQKYATDLQNEVSEFNKENASFSYEVQKALADAQSTNQVALQNGVQEARDAIENNNSEIARFQSMSQHYGTQVNEDIQKYTAQIQALSADIQASTAEHAAELQGTQAEYQWLQDQYTRLKAEYDQAFMIAAPKQPEAQEAA